ncbi:integrase catalytic domain-containing protein [Trichonephila clavipes]|nr:integrase catalytic domain-containing protein [Trichonephila clavipes]
MLFQNDIPIDVACHRYTLNMQVSSGTKNNSSPDEPSCTTVTVSLNGVLLVIQLDFKCSSYRTVTSSSCRAISSPFSVVGINFGGHLYTKDENKHYIVLFTCAVTRALHLELVNNLTTETFLLALRRFISRRRLCSKILTDNAKTFKGSEIELKNLWKVISDPAVKAFYASHKIYWQFIIERAPWWGGFYERLIQTVKLYLQRLWEKQLYFAMSWRLF